MTAIDLAMVGALGASALASVGIMGQPEMVMLIFCRALSIAVTAIIARRHGEGDVDGMNAVLKQSILLNFLIYVPLLVICFFNFRAYFTLYWRRRWLYRNRCLVWSFHCYQPYFSVL